MQLQFTQLHSFESYFIDKFAEKLFCFAVTRFYYSFTVHVNVLLLLLLLFRFPPCPSVVK